MLRLVASGSVRHGGRPMKSFQRIANVFVVIGLSQFGTAFGDSFFDFGLQWTQWLPTQGQVRRYESDDKSTVLSVPAPKSNTRTESAKIVAVASNATSYTPPYQAPTQPVYTPQPAAVVPPPVVAPPIVQPVAYSVPVQASGSTVSMPSSYFAGSTGSSTRFDALINMGDGAYPLASQLVTGQPQAWYESSVVKSIYGGTPTVDQQKSFEQDVLQKVQQTYANSGISVSVTTDPHANAARTISVVSGASFGSIHDAAGITASNGDGFSFIDKLTGANNLSDLEWAVAHNVAHEMMHSFNVDHHDTTGQFLDGAVANWSMLLDPNTKFSSAAVTDIQNNLANGLSTIGDSNTTGFLGEKIIGKTDALMIAPQPVPEPTTIAMWAASLLFGYVVNKKRQCRLCA